MKSPLEDKCIWATGSGESITFESALERIGAHAKTGAKIFIGSDSSPKGEKFVFATAICVHGADGMSGGKYFFKKGFASVKSMPTLFHRMSREVQNAVDVALYVESRIPNADIEIHIDIGENPRGRTWKFVESLTGYAKSTGFPVKIKPNAWASASVADKHSKN